MHISELYSYLLNLKSEGYFSEYSESHIILRALNGEERLFAEALKNYTTLKVIQLDFSPVVLGKYNGNPFSLISKIDDALYPIDAHNFLINLSNRLKPLHEIFKDDFGNFLKHQFAAGKANYKESTFFQAYSEVQVLSFIATRTGRLIPELCVYEPTTKDCLANPEAKFVYYDDITFNVEIKTPENQQYEIPEGYIGILQPTVPIDKDNLKPLKDFLQQNKIKFEFPKILKLKDYIVIVPNFVKNICNFQRR